MELPTFEQIELAKVALQGAFPKAQMISVSFEFDAFDSGNEEASWHVYVGFYGRKNISGVAYTLKDAVEKALATPMPPLKHRDPAEEAMAKAVQLSPLVKLATSRIHKPENN